MRGDRRPSVVVVLLNWCAEELTRDCVESLRRTDYRKLSVILVDNGSPDGSGERLRRAFPDLCHIQTGSNLGFTGGNNVAIGRALADGYEYVLLLNNDTTVDADCVTWLVQAAQSEPNVGAVGGKIMYHDEPDRIWFAGGDLSRLRMSGLHRSQGAVDGPGTAETVEEVSFLTGCCMLIPADVLRDVGRFREDLFAYLEDVDLSLRLSSAGYRLLYQPRARIYHRIPRAAGTIAPEKIALRDRNRRRVARAHLNGLERMGFVLFFYPTRLLLAFMYAVRGDHPRAAAVWRGMSER
jgi:GT2 family glycosyltransferase